MRLIDADELKRDLRQYFTEGVLDGVSAKLTFHQILRDIDNEPTVDKGYNEGHIDGMLKAEKLYARPTGEWIHPSKSPEIANKDFFSDCSNCGYTQMDESNYCPNCGAKMLPTLFKIKEED